MINGCRRPVVVVPDGHEPPTRLSAIGVAFVPTPEGRRAPRVAGAIARIAGAKLRVLTVMKPTLGADASAGLAKEAAERDRAELEAIVSVATAAQGDGIRIESEVFIGDAADALVRVSAHPDLLVIGSRGSGPMFGVLLGSVSRRVTTVARCPVLVVPRASAATSAALCRIYADETAARRAAEPLGDTGVARLVTGRRPNDVPAQVVGSFAGALVPSAPVGTFASVPRRRQQGAGSFAGDPDEQRQNSFGDIDRNVIARHENGAVRSRVAARREVQRLLENVEAGDVERVLDKLYRGHHCHRGRRARRCARDTRRAGPFRVGTPQRV
jgi:nucleotide-binding universal stress UspA family protein